MKNELTALPVVAWLKIDGEDFEFNTIDQFSFGRTGGTALVNRDKTQALLDAKDAEIAALKENRDAWKSAAIANLVVAESLRVEIATLKTLIGRIESELTHAEINDMRLTPAFGKVIGLPAVPLANIRAAMAQVVQPTYTNPVMPEERAKLKVALTQVFGWEKP